MSDTLFIVPMLKQLARPDGAGTLADLAPADTPVVRPLAADVVVMYAIDRPNRLEYITRKTFDTMDMDLDALHQLAVRNLPRCLDRIQLHDCGDGVIGISAGGTFEATLLLLDDLWPRLAPHLPGQPLAAIPSRDLIFTIGSAQPRAFELIAERARTPLADRHHALSTAVFIRQDHGWSAYNN
ncbi:hypothetical protein H3H36_03700 [Duganella sp. FT3S]|uniref:Uncharacterized protein n=1 Tax=Rugamonas fusca TaxID=2758568 RepID=A0A7W2EEG1_9BURK|nr:hypothetical protein [Rugamonas fusca]MBA5604464.1 hypothetical protein [Rugamonas fusca]